jgi:small multidrug resistance family-3 protein
MRNFLDQVVAHRSGALSVLLLAALLEAYGDSSFQTALYRTSGNRRIIAFLGGAACLAAYGLVVNIPRWDFGKLLGIYVVFFFLVAQGINWVRFGQSPTLPVVMGGSLIVAGGAIIAAFGK